MVSLIGTPLLLAVLFAFSTITHAHVHTIVFVDSDAVDIIDNWLCWSKRNRNDDVTLVATDKATLALLQYRSHQSTHKVHDQVGAEAGYALAETSLRQKQKVAITSAEVLLLSKLDVHFRPSCWLVTDPSYRLQLFTPSQASYQYFEAFFACQRRLHARKYQTCLGVAALQLFSENPPCAFTASTFSDFFSTFVSHSPQNNAFFPSFIDFHKHISPRMLQQTLMKWNLWLETAQCTRKLGPTCPFTASKPRFSLTVRVLTLNRVQSLRRAINSLKKANYDQDSVDLEVWVDHPPNASTTEHDEVVRYVKYGLQWPHGNLQTHVWEKNQGIIKQWIRRFEPKQPGGVLLILEDDLEVAPSYYVWAKTAISHYYLNCSNFDHRTMGLSLERLHELIGNGRLFWLAEKYPDIVTSSHSGSGAVYASQKDSSWAPIVFPEAWNGFVDWYWTRGRYNKRPCVYGLISNKWMTDTIGAIWTPWLHRFIFETGSYFLYFNYGVFPHEWVPKAVVRNHRETGLHFEKKKAKALHRWQPFVDFDLDPKLLNPKQSIVTTDFFLNTVADVDSLEDRWRTTSNLRNSCHVFW